MRKDAILLVVVLAALLLFTACAEQEEMLSNNSNMITPTVGVAEVIKPTLSPTPTKVPSPTLGVDASRNEAGAIEESMPDEDACLFEYEVKADGTIRITGIKDRILSTVCIPETIEEQYVTEIGAEAFAGCKNLTDIEIPLSVTTIGEEAFKGCSELKTVELSYALNSISENAFAECAIDSFVVSQGTYPEFWAGRNSYRVSYSHYSLETDISMNMNEISVGGERYSAVYGETGALIWKYVDATFDTEGHYLLTFIMAGDSLPNMELADEEKGIYCTQWTRWFGMEKGSSTFISVGDDMFERVSVFPTYTRNEREFVNGKEGIVFFANAMNIPNRLNENGKYWFSKVERLNEYSDGYSLMCIFYEYRITGDWQSSYVRKYCWVDTHGKIINYIDFEESLVGPYNNSAASWDYRESIYHDEESYFVSSVGAYSDGVFYSDGKFLDLDLNVVLDMNDKGYQILADESVYTPKFVDGICTLIVYKNSKFWMFDIDKSGNTISEPEEIDILWLSY